MPDIHQLLLFFVAGWLLNITPGPDVLYIVSNALRNGVRTGLVAGLGITAGCCVHVVGAALGLGALLAASAWAFTLVKWLGAGYLFWIGMRMVITPLPAKGPDLDEQVESKATTSLREVFLGGFWTNVLNPKVVIFFLAFLPQFISPEAPNKTLWFLVLGLLFNVNSIPINVGWALTAGWLARRKTVQSRMAWLDRLAGTMFVGFGIKLAVWSGASR